jgi:hypothetical protein
LGFRVPGADEYAGTGFGVLATDSYRCRIESFVVKSGEEVTNQYNPKGEPRVWFTLTPLAIDGDDDAELVDPDGEPVSDEKTLLFFFDPKRLGLKPVVAKSRKFFAAAMGIEVDQPVDFDSLDALCKALVGRELVVTVEAINGKNKITDSRAVKQRVRRQRAPAPMVEAAAAVFDQPVPEEPAEDLL